jgi:hypothetical protein
MEKYLYLTKLEWVDAWINEGEIPINLASIYLSNTRDGTSTPDENLIHQSVVPIPYYKQHGISIENCKNVTISNFRSNGIKLPSVKNAKYYLEDGGILSLCNTFDVSIAKKLGKSACIKILDVETIRKSFGKQLGCKAVMGECQYTTDHQRGQFLKSVEDSWQNEYRIFFPTTKLKSVRVPARVAEFVSEIK